MNEFEFEIGKQEILPGTAKGLLQPLLSQQILVTEGEHIARAEIIHAFRSILPQLDQTGFSYILLTVAEEGKRRGWLPRRRERGGMKRPIFQIETRFSRSGPDYRLPLSKNTKYQVMCNGKFSPFFSPWDEDELLALRRELRYGVGVVPVDRLREIGNALRDAMEDTGLPEALAQARVLAQTRKGCVQLRFVIQYAELALIPWELMTEPRQLGNRFIIEVTVPPHSIVRESPVLLCEGETQVPDLTVSKILFVYATAGDPHFPWHGHFEVLKNLTRASEIGFHAVEIKTPRDLEQAVSRLAPVDIIHILGHGSRLPSQGAEIWGIRLDNGTGDAEVRSGEQLGTLLTMGGTVPSLVVLSVCDSGNPGDVSNEMGSMAQALHSYGIPAVIGSQFPLSKEGSVRMTQQLYEALFNDGLSLSEAILRVRAFLFQGQFHDWASLTLYSRYPRDIRFALRREGVDRN